MRAQVRRVTSTVRATVYLASVLFLIGISTRFPLRGGRYALVGLGALMLMISVVQLCNCPAHRPDQWGKQ